MEKATHGELVQLPRITFYTSATIYLRDLYEYRKSLDPKFSYEIWSLELGFKSKSTLRMICHGQRNISAKFVNLFAKNQRFTRNEKEYFLLLAKLLNAKDKLLQEVYEDKLLEQRDVSVRKVEVESAATFLSKPLFVKLQLLISFEDFIATEENLGKMLNVSVPVMREALLTLERIGLIERRVSEDTSQSMWRSNAKYFCVTNNLHAEAMASFHRATSKEAQVLINAGELTQKFKSLYFSLSGEDYGDLINTLDLFSNKLKAKYGNNFIRRKKIYKINFQVYPVTETCP